MMKKLLSMLVVLMLAVSMCTAGIAVTNYPITENGNITFKMYAPNHSTVLESLDEHVIVKDIEEKSGLQFEFVHPTGGDEAMFFSTLIASGDYPDIYMTTSVFSKYYPGGVDAAIDDGLLLDVTELVEEYAVNFNARIASMDAYAQKAIRSDTGRIVKFGGQVFGKDFVEGRTSDGILLRKDFLEKVGLEAPVTIEYFVQSITLYFP